MESSIFIKEIDSRQSIPTERGFTLVEMLVSLAIMTLIMTVAVTGQSSYNRSILLNDTAYTVALSLRQAQSYGLSSRKAGTFQNAGYGIYLTDSGLTSYRLFADTSSPVSNPPPAWCPPNSISTPDSKPGNCLYDSTGPPDITIQVYSFSRGFSFSKFCGKVGPTTNCSGSGLSTLNIEFIRPNNKTIITGRMAITGAKTKYDCAELWVKDPTSAAVKIVRVSSLGEISIGQTCP